MNVHISYKVSKTADLEKLLDHQVDKLSKYLRVFRPELVHLKAAIEDDAPGKGVSVSLNLRLPSGQMAARENGATFDAAAKAAFDALTEQLKKHKDLLRSHHKFERRRDPKRALTATVPFEETLAAVQLPKVSPADVSNYLDVSLPRLRHFIERQINYRESQGQLLAGQVTMEDVLNEVVASALDEQPDQPERVKLEPWLYRMATEALNRLTTPANDERDIPLERSHGVQNVQATDEATLQFHQPDDRLSEENVIADSTANNPEELAARSELIRLVATTLRDAGPDAREAFILYTVEGFTPGEIADITNRGVEEVRASIRLAREHLQRALPLKDVLKDKLVEYSKSA